MQRAIKNKDLKTAGMRLTGETKTIILNVPEQKVYDFSKRLGLELKHLIQDLHAPHTVLIEEIPGLQIKTAGSAFGVWEQTEIQFKALGHEITEVTISIVTGRFMGRTASGHVMRYLVGSFKSFEMGYLANKPMITSGS
jgi:hypothetical protein